MSILDEKLSIVAEKLINKDGRNKLYDRIADCPGKYEWARIVMLIGGQKLLLDGENLSFSIVFKRYGMEKFYGLGAFQKAIGTALTGKTGNARGGTRTWFTKLRRETTDFEELPYDEPVPFDVPSA